MPNRSEPQKHEDESEIPSEPMLYRQLCSDIRTISRSVQELQTIMHEAAVTTATMRSESASMREQVATLSRTLLEGSGGGIPGRLALLEASVAEHRRWVDAENQAKASAARETEKADRATRNQLLASLIAGGFGVLIGLISLAATFLRR